MTTNIDYTAMTRAELKQRLELELSGGSPVNIFDRTKPENEPFIDLYHAIAKGDVAGVKAAKAAGVNFRTDIDCDRYNKSLSEFAAGALTIAKDLEESRALAEEVSGHTAAVLKGISSNQAVARAAGARFGIGVYPSEVELMHDSLVRNNPYKAGVKRGGAEEILQIVEEEGSIGRDDKIIRRNVLEALDGSGYDWKFVHVYRYEGKNTDDASIDFHMPVDGEQISKLRIDYASPRNTLAGLKHRFHDTPGIAPGSPTAKLVDAVKADDLMKASEILWMNTVDDHSISPERFVNTNAWAMVKGADGKETRKTLVEGAFGDVSPEMRNLLFQSGNAFTAKQQDALMAAVEGKIPPAANITGPHVAAHRPSHPGFFARMVHKLGYGTA